MRLEVIMAGFGGQGVLLMGQLLTYAGMLEDKNVVWFPSYGPEMRGGEVFCTVIVSDSEIGSPVVAESDVVVVLHNASLAKFARMVRPGGLLLLNSTLVTDEVGRTDCRIARIPATGKAEEMGNQKAANVVMLGALISLTGAVRKESVVQAFREIFPPDRHEKLIPLNLRALEEGMNLASALAG